MALPDAAPARGSRHQRQGHPVHRRGARASSRAATRARQGCATSSAIIACDHAQARAREGRGRGRRVDHRQREGRGGPRRAALCNGRGGEGAGDRRGHRTRVDDRPAATSCSSRRCACPGAASSRSPANSATSCASRSMPRYSFVRSRATPLGIPESEFRESDLHLHFPAGAIPKDGPQRGRRRHARDRERPVPPPCPTRRRDDRRSDAARQGARDRRREGEDARGVSGRAARGDHAEGQRQGPPRRAHEVRENMAFTFVATMDEVLHLALLPAPEPSLADQVAGETPPTADRPAAEAEAVPAD